MDKEGKVYLVGAGPGDSGLITLKGVECLKQAGVVLYDHLVNPDLLSYIGAETEIIYAGKTGSDHTLSQDEINNLMLKLAGEGKVVVRLKGGDPFLFGRGGEEAYLLAKARVDFEVVPGISSALAVPAYAGIPLTHRQVASSVAIITGHEDPTRKESSLDWGKLATATDTLVILMGIAQLAEIVEELTTYGRDPLTPIAIIRWGTTPQQQVITGNLSNIVERAGFAGITPPGIIVVGEVVSLRAWLNWIEQRPLFGRSILVTRATAQAGTFKRLLESCGAGVVEFPTIKIVPPASFNGLDQAISRINNYHWIIFTSVNGVKFFFDRLWEKGLDSRELSGIKIAAIGPSTAAEIEKLHLRVDYQPRNEFRAESVVEGLKQSGGAGERGSREVAGAGVEGLCGSLDKVSILLPRAEEARDTLPTELTKLGAGVDVVTAYRTVQEKNNRAHIERLLAEHKIDVVTFTSSSTVTNFVSAFADRDLTGLLKGVKVACIGPITESKARKLGLRVDIAAPEYTISGLTEAIIDYFVSP
ncbi:MAG: uroporphyrinogen-III C-methyltransferase [bacterium]|nr:uroporphyrinogen-III C-methyltransferase [bacterium]